MAFPSVTYTARPKKHQVLHKNSSVFSAQQTKKSTYIRGEALAWVLFIGRLFHMFSLDGPAIRSSTGNKNKPKGVHKSLYF